MLNLLRMDFYRLWRSRSFVVMIFVSISIALFTIFVAYYDIQQMKEPKSTIIIGSEKEEENHGVNIGMQVDTEEMFTGDEMDFTRLINFTLAGRILAILCVVFPAIFVYGEQKNGFIKNIAGQLPNRGMLVLSKMLVLAVQTLIIFVVFTLAGAIMAKILWKENLLLNSIGDFAKIMGLHYLLHWAFAIVVASLTIILRGTGFSITYGILTTNGVMAILYGFIDKVINNKNFDISLYTLEDAIARVSETLSGGDLQRVLLVGISFIVAFTALAMMVIQKRDVR